METEIRNTGKCKKGNVWKRNDGQPLLVKDVMWLMMGHNIVGYRFNEDGDCVAAYTASNTVD